jgi:hypothetical protein
VVAPPRPLAVLHAPPAHALLGPEPSSCPAAVTCDSCEECAPCASCEVCEAARDASVTDVAVHWIGVGVRTALTLLSELQDGVLVGGAVLLSSCLLGCCSCCPRRVREAPTAQTRLAAYRR